MPSFSRNLERSLHRALAFANERQHEYATLEHLLLALTEDDDAVAVMQACNVELDRLREELDSYLAFEFGVNADDADAYTGWRLSHHPFHWFVEFHGIMRGGGFDVIIGNPPYVQYPSKKVPYQLDGLGYRTLSTKNLYALIFERCVSLADSDSPIGLIVQLTSLSSERVSPLQGMLLDRGTLHASAFPRRPQSIFEGVEMPVSILISTPATGGRLFTTNVRRFYASEKELFIDLMRYFQHDVVIDGHRVAKFGGEIDAAIYRKLAAQNSNLGSLASDTRKGTLYYQEACRYWAKATNVKPFYRKNEVQSEPAHWRSFAMASEEASAFAACLLNSSLFYWYYSMFSDCEHVNDGLVRRFPIPPDWNRRDWQKLCSSLLLSLGKGATRKTISTKQGHFIEYDEISGASSKESIDLIDNALAALYGLSSDELDYIIRYDIKYRVGLVESV